MKRGALLPLVSSVVLLLGSSVAWAGQYDEKERAELAQALKGAKVSLKQGIVASAPKGKPISGKFEVEDGKLQLSVYTTKGGAVSEVLVDPKSGRVAKILRRPRHRPTQWQRPRHHCRQQSMPPSRRIQGFGPSAWFLL